MLTFSPSFMISALRVSSILPEPLAIAIPDNAAMSAGLFFAAVSAAFFANATKSSFLATKSVSQFTSTTAPVLPSLAMNALTTPSAVTRLAALLALAPLLMRNCSSATFKLPFDSTSAFLHSIMPRPVASRSSLTILAVISDIFYSVINIRQKFLISHSTLACRRHQLGVFRQYAARVAGHGGLPGGATARNFCIIHIELQQALLRIYGHRVTLVDQRNRAAHRCFRRNMPDHHAVSAAGETTIGDKADGIAQTFADDGRGGRQHLAHTGAALGAFITDDHHIARFYFTREDGFHARLFRIEHARRSGDLVQLDTGDLRHRTFRRKITLQDGKVSLRINRIVPRTDHILILSRLGRHILQNFRNGLAGNGQRIAMQNAMREQYLHHLRNPAGTMQVGGDIFSGRLQIAQHRHACAYDFEVIDRERYLRGMCDGQEMQQHRVGGTAHRHG